MRITSLIVEKIKYKITWGIIMIRMLIQINLIILLTICTLCQCSNSKDKNSINEYSYGYKRGDRSIQQKYLTSDSNLIKETRAAYPSSYDGRNCGLVTPAKQQGYYCGSCWAFAFVAAAETSLIKEYNLRLDLSEQHVISCTSLSNGCCGGDPITAGISFLELGFLPEDVQGYLESSTQCPPVKKSISCSNIPFYEGMSIKLFSAMMSYHTSDIKALITNAGSAIMCFDVYDDFQSFWRWDSGIYTNSENSQRGQGHCVQVVGWDDNEAAWLCKNSWGSNWGPDHDGTFWISYSGHAHDLNFDITALRVSKHCDYVPCTRNSCLREAYGNDHCENYCD
jgi:C1A family cysteine protease